METKSRLIFCFFAFQLLMTASGLQCWSCSNVRSVDECLKTGQLKTCQVDQETACFTEERKSAGWGETPLVQKGCKQAHACGTDLSQNDDQCKPDETDSVCRYCCNEDRCNMRNFWNTSAETGFEQCNLFPPPVNGAFTCDYAVDEGELGSRCTFLCNPGYILTGSAESTCTQKEIDTVPAFDNDPAVCIESRPPPIIPVTESTVKTTTKTGVLVKLIIESVAPPTEMTPQPEIPLSDCEIPPDAPLNGGRNCLSVRGQAACFFYCGENEYMEGPGLITCTDALGWNAKAPTCLVSCMVQPEYPDNSVTECEGFGEVGTNCSFTCNPGFELSGPASIRCIMRNNRAIWDNDAPKCILSL